jgi:hypothetical protein
MVIYQQLRKAANGMNEPLLVVCYMDRLEVHTNFTSTQKQVYGVYHLPTNKRLNATSA